MATVISSCLVAMGLTLATMAVSAAPTIYFGEEIAPGGSVSGAPSAARGAFLATLSGVGSEGFESFAPNTSPPPIVAHFVGSSGNLTATLTGGSLGVVDATFDKDLGRFNTTLGGSKWWLADTGLTIDFSAPVAAFGFYGTDIGDFSGQLTIALTDVSDHVTTLTVGHTVSGPSGSLLFWGFIDPSVQYKRISFGNTSSGFDGLGFDDFVVGDVGQVRNPQSVPEPAMLPLVLAGLGWVAIACRRRRW